MGVAKSVNHEMARLQGGVDPVAVVEGGQDRAAGGHDGDGRGSVDRSKVPDNVLRGAATR